MKNLIRNDYIDDIEISLWKYEEETKVFFFFTEKRYQYIISVNGEHISSIKYCDYHTATHFYEMYKKGIRDGIIIGSRNKI